VEVATHRDDPALEEVDGGPSLAFGQRGLQRVGDAAPAVRADHDAVQHDGQARRVEPGGHAARAGRHLGQVQHRVTRLDPGETALEQGGEQGAGCAARGQRKQIRARPG
jgi:hypothetical protein